MTEEKKLKVKVKIPEPDWNKILSYCRAAKPNEIIGLAHVEIVDRCLFVNNPLILKQKVTGGTCEVETKDLVKFVSEYEHIAKVKCVWHSHVNMSAFFSSCDRDTSEKLAQLGTMMRGSESMFVSIVANVRGEYECKIDIFSPFTATMEGEIILVQPREIEDEVKEMVSERKYESTSSPSTPSGSLPYYGGGYGSGYRQSELPGHAGSRIPAGARGERPWSDDDIFSEIPYQT